MKRIKGWIRANLVQPVKKMSKVDVFRSILLGFYGGLFPVPGVTTFAVIGLVAITKVLGVHISAPALAFALTLNLMLTPLNIATLPVFSGVGVQWLQPNMVCPWTKMFEISFRQMVADFSLCIGVSILLWCSLFPVYLIGVLLSPPLYDVLAGVVIEKKRRQHCTTGCELPTTPTGRFPLMHDQYKISLFMDSGNESPTTASRRLPLLAQQYSAPLPVLKSGVPASCPTTSMSASEPSTSSPESRSSRASSKGLTEHRENWQETDRDAPGLDEKASGTTVFRLVAGHHKLESITTACPTVHLNM